MAALSDETDTIKFVHTYGVGLHSNDIDPDVHDPRWQRRQVDEFVDFAVLAEELGFDGVTVTRCRPEEPAGSRDLRHPDQIVETLQRTIDVTGAPGHERGPARRASALTGRDRAAAPELSGVDRMFESCRGWGS
jgi:hypothetical protein